MGSSVVQRAFTSASFSHSHRRSCSICRSSSDIDIDDSLFHSSINKNETAEFDEKAELLEKKLARYSSQFGQEQNNNNISWKNINLSFNLDFRKGGDVFNGNEYILYFTGLSTRTLDREKTIIIKGVLADGLENSAKPTTNTIAVTPYYRTDYFGTGAVTEADFIESVDWIRLRDITLSYNFSPAFLGKQRLFKTASVFVTGTDLFLITNYTGADPSVNANTAFARGYGGAGIDYGAIATPRAVAFGIRAQF